MRVLLVERHSIKRYYIYIYCDMEQFLCRCGTRPDSRRDGEVAGIYRQSVARNRCAAGHSVFFRVWWSLFYTFGTSVARSMSQYASSCYILETLCPAIRKILTSCATPSRDEFCYRKAARAADCRPERGGAPPWGLRLQIIQYPAQNSTPNLKKRSIEKQTLGICRILISCWPRPTTTISQKKSRGARSSALYGWRFCGRYKCRTRWVGSDIPHDSQPEATWYGSRYEIRWLWADIFMISSQIREVLDMIRVC